ncbi:hypothetical protein DEJ50_19350 [Streptomyces venezuelae]|uniref:Guanylate cyclase domain-containing protein n=1 Tax=Streptomyces venezuelae TaxID=54571 RepID=A0A5P2D3A1_STRVZ|nr:hypothetical protein [Streptomyces venezuelae]QES49642.1 hypothetical protein DEJ50_19350 [Streptomyces venezuelae]
MAHPLNRNLLLLDIEKFSDRDDVEQAYLRRMLYDVLDRVLQEAGIDQTHHRRDDRGDGVLVMIDANAPLTALLRVLLTEAPAQLRSVNRMASSAAQIRLRAVVATGFVTVDANDGGVGDDLNLAFRLLDADGLRAALRERTEDIALCVSESVYTGIVRHDHTGIPRSAFHEFTVNSKNGPLKAWLYGPLPAAVSAAAPAPEPHRLRAGRTASGSGSSGGGQVDFHGTNNGIVAHQINGPIVQGGVINGGISMPTDRGDRG